MPRLKVGMKVTSPFNPSEKDIVRTLTRMERQPNFGSKYGASADGGEPCPTCGHCPGTPIPYVDSSWFKEVIK